MCPSFFLIDKKTMLSSLPAWTAYWIINLCPGKLNRGYWEAHSTQQNKIALVHAYRSLSQVEWAPISLTLHPSPSLILPLPHPPSPSQSTCLPSVSPLSLLLSHPLPLTLPHSSSLHLTPPSSLTFLLLSVSLTYTIYIGLSLCFCKSLFSIPPPFSSPSWLGCWHLWFPWKPLTWGGIN